MWHFLAQNGPFVKNKIFLVQTIIITFIYLLPFSLCKILKNSYSGSRVIRMCHFWAKNGPFAPNFFLENYYYDSHLPISPFHCAKFWKTSSNGFRVLRMHNFWAQKGPFPQMRIFFQKTLEWALFLSLMHIYRPKIKVRY